MGKIITIILVYLAIFMLWIFNVLIPIGTNLLTHIQDYANKGGELDLIYCAKQLLWIILLGVACKILGWIICLLIIKR